MEEELAPLTVQLALVQSRLGRRDEALAAVQVLLLSLAIVRV